MKRNRYALAAALLALSVAGVAEAQVPPPPPPPPPPPGAAGMSVRAEAVRIMQRGVLGLMTETIVTSSGSVSAGQRVITGSPGQRVVVDVVPESPAGRAGIVRGDTIISVNGSPVTDQLMSGFEPGETVVLRVRRNGAERDVRVVADDRSAIRYALPLPDSLSRRISVILDAARADAAASESALRAIMVERMLDDSLRITRMSNDSMVVITGRASAARVATPLMIDSLRRSMASVEALARLHADSATWILRSGDADFIRRATGDSVLHFAARPLNIMSSSASLGMRAVYGAELAELNAGLAEYFNVASGVLVLNASEGTPAARAGLRGGDVIVQINQTPVTSVAELRRQIDAVRPGTAVTLRVLRHGAPLDVSLPR